PGDVQVIHRGGESLLGLVHCHGDAVLGALRGVGVTRDHRGGSGGPGGRAGDRGGGEDGGSGDGGARRGGQSGDRARDGAQPGQRADDGRAEGGDGQGDGIHGVLPSLL